MVAEHHDQRLVGGVIEVGGAAGFGQPHGDPVGTEEGDDVQGLPAGEGRIECTHIFYDEDPGETLFAADKSRAGESCNGCGGGVAAPGCGYNIAHGTSPPARRRPASESSVDNARIALISVFS